MESDMNNQYNRDYSSLISPRGTRQRLKTKREQFEEIIQYERDQNQNILNSLVKPYNK